MRGKVLVGKRPEGEKPGGENTKRGKDLASALVRANLKGHLTYKLRIIEGSYSFELEKKPNSVSLRVQHEMKSAPEMTSF